MLEEDELKDAALMVFANKQDLPNALPADAIAEKVHTHTHKHVHTLSRSRLLTCTRTRRDNGGSRLWSGQSRYAATGHCRRRCASPPRRLAAAAVTWADACPRKREDPRSLAHLGASTRGVWCVASWGWGV